MFSYADTVEITNIEYAECIQICILTGTDVSETGKPYGTFMGRRLGRGLGPSWHGLWKGLGGSLVVACSTTKDLIIFLFGAADAADPRERSELAAERPTSASGASCGREAATRTSAAIRNVLSTVYAPSGTERLPTTAFKSAENFLGLAILFRPQGRGLLIFCGSNLAGYLHFPYFIALLIFLGHCVIPVVFSAHSTSFFLFSIGLISRYCVLLFDSIFTCPFLLISHYN